MCLYLSYLSSQLLLVSFSFFFFFLFDLIFPFVPWSHSIFVLRGLFTLPEKTLAPFHLGARGVRPQPLEHSTVSFGDWNVVTDRVQTFSFNFFFFFKREEKLVREETSCENGSVFRQTPLCKKLKTWSSTLLGNSHA